MANIETGFPKNLAWNMKKLDAGFTKTKVKIYADKQTVNANDILRFRIPAVSGALYDFRTPVMYATGATSGNNANCYLHFPRYSSSLIQSLSCTINNTTLSSINEYAYLYNRLMDLEGADFSQLSKRITENYDPSVKFTAGASPDNKITCVKAVDTTDSAENDTGVKLAINNWLGFLGSCSTPCLPLENMGDLFVNIQLSPATVLWHTNHNTATGAIDQVNANFTLSDVYITIDRITFQSPEYYQIMTRKLDPESDAYSGGLNLGFYDYYLCTGSSVTKSSGVSMNFNVNSPSLDQCIAVFRRKDYQNIRPLALYGASTATRASEKTFAEVLANPVANSGTATDIITGNPVLGDAFNNSMCFASVGNDITSSTWSINSVQITPYPIPPVELFNNVLQYTGFQNLDLGTSGLHPGCLSLKHFLRYYFVDICSLENISGDSQFYVSGLDGRAGGLNIQYNATFGTNSGEIYPYVWCRSTRTLNIKAGRQIELDPPMNPR